MDRMHPRQISWMFRKLNEWVSEWNTHPPRTEQDWGKIMKEAEQIDQTFFGCALERKLILAVLDYWESCQKAQEKQTGSRECIEWEGDTE